MPSKIRLVPGQPPILPASSAKDKRFPSKTSAKASPHRVTAYVEASFFQAAQGDRGYWGAVIADSGRDASARIRELCGSCAAHCAYDAAIAGTASVIASIAQYEGPGRVLKVYAPKIVVAQMLKWEAGLRLNRKWSVLQDQCVAYGPIEFDYPSVSRWTGPRMRRAKQLARELASELGGVAQADTTADLRAEIDNLLADRDEERGATGGA